MGAVIADTHTEGDRESKWWKCYTQSVACRLKQDVWTNVLSIENIQ